MSVKPKKSVRVHLDLNPKCRETLERLSESTSTSLSEVLRRSLALFDIVVQEQQSGGKVLIRNQEGEREIVLL